jgi:hypothetical protein
LLRRLHQAHLDLLAAGVQRRERVPGVDGSSQQFEAIQAEAARRGVTVLVICELIHVLLLPGQSLAAAKPATAVAFLYSYPAFFTAIPLAT